MSTVLSAPESLKQIIEQKRRSLIQLGLVLGLTHPLTVQTSEELDQLILKSFEVKNYFLE
ncbi:Spo0E family sporulation regulatory protein-aspartic acid phosphatase [Cytobacillus sp. FJAT-54145]|uniref:Spo0E family sporulation regulatory protein-aspartic acid phosphatase n=1 Tax=Cytobacillus spartinae TaxID=3299023 RepID=A0ABW6KBG9_9BACI